MEGEDQTRPEARKPDPKPSEKKAKERLARPPKDRREITIGPTTKAGPDITLG